MYCHVFLTNHSVLYIVDYTDHPECSAQLLSIKHTVTECSCYNQTRLQCYFHTNLKDIFQPFSQIIDSIKNISLYDKL